jgi:hypothetical protein
VLAAGGTAVGVSPASAAAPQRAYELVSPADTKGTNVKPQSTSKLGPRFNPVRGDGDSVIFATTTAFVGQDENGYFNDYRALRTANGWETSYIGLPGSSPSRGSGLAQASEDQAQTIQETIFGGSPDPSDPNPEDSDSQAQRLFLRNASGAISRISVGSAMGPRPGSPDDAFLAATPDLSGVLFTTNQRLEDDPGGTGGSGGLRWYVRQGGKTTLVTIAPNGHDLIDPDTSALMDPASRDLTRIYIPESGATGRVYLRTGGRTVEASASRRTAPQAAQKVDLLGVSDDGSSAVLRTAEALTDTDTDSAQDLYEYRLPESGDPAGSSLTLLSEGPVGGGGEAEADFLNASSDHEYMYVLSSERLTADAVADTPNVYVRHAGETSLVASLAPGDDGLVRGFTDPASSPPRYRETRVAAGGRVLLFRSTAAIAGAAGGTINVFRFDAATAGVSCVSCRPDGAPSAAEALLRPPSFAVDTFEVETRNATSDGRRVFFQTDEPLLSADTNGRPDVYEYDAEDDTTSLVSPGTGPAAYYYGNGSDGRDVFFVTSETLVPQDRNGQRGALRIYDARVGGGFAAPAPVSPCAGESCRGSAADPPDELPLSSAVAGRAGDPPVAAQPKAPRTPQLTIGRVSSAQGLALARRGRMTVSLAGLPTGRKTANVALTVRSRRRTVTIARGSRTTSAGRASVTVRLTTAGRRLLRDHTRLRAQITARLGTDGKKAVRTVTVRGTKTKTGSR